MQRAGARRPPGKHRAPAKVRVGKKVTARPAPAANRKAIAISKEDPSKLYPDFDFFIELLNSENQIIKWTAIQVIGNLSKVDKKTIRQGDVSSVLFKQI